MSVLVNFKICDNSNECSGIASCPTKALYWNEKKKSIGIDNSKCTACRKCEEACPVGAIKVAKTQTEYKKIKKEVDEDPRKRIDLFVDKYGGTPINVALLIKEDEFNKEIEKANRPIAVELFNAQSIQCLLKSIPIKQLLKNTKFDYRKVELKSSNILKKYKIKELPCLLFFNKGKLLGKIEGYYSSDKEEEIKDKIKVTTQNFAQNFL